MALTVAGLQAPVSFFQGHGVKSGQASTGNSVAPEQQAAAFVGNGATYAPGQETKNNLLVRFLFLSHIKRLIKD